MPKTPEWLMRKMSGLTKIDRQIIEKNFQENRTPEELIELIRSFRKTKSFNRPLVGPFRMRG